jgi:hypothetical protein
MDSGLLLLVTAEYVEQASVCQLTDDGLTDADCPVVAAAGHPLSDASGP